MAETRKKNALPFLSGCLATESNILDAGTGKTAGPRWAEKAQTNSWLRRQAY